VIVNPTALLVPPGVVSVMICGPVGAFEAITRVAVICVPLTTVKGLAVTPVGRFSVAPVRNVPVMVTGKLPPTKPVARLILLSPGTGGLMRNDRVPGLVPNGVVIVTLCGPMAAAASMAKVAVACVAFTTTRLVTVIPGTLTAVAPVRNAPVRVTPKLVP